MKIISPAFKNNQPIPKKYTCLGENISPPLNFYDIPKEAKSLVLWIEDLSSGNPTWIHWMVFNIPADCPGFSEGCISCHSVEGLANNHSFGYEGPCPKYFKGTHQYIFRLFALSDYLSLPKDSDKKQVEQAMKGLIVNQAQLIGLCSSS